MLELSREMTMIREDSVKRVKRTDGKTLDVCKERKAVQPRKIQYVAENVLSLIQKETGEI